jgi:hypothetical protein
LDTQIPVIVTVPVVLAENISNIACPIPAHKNGQHTPWSEGAADCIRLAIEEGEKPLIALTAPVPEYTKG